MEYYSAMRQNEITKFSGKWMELELIMLLLVMQTLKTVIYSPSHVDASLNFLDMWMCKLE